MGSAAAKAARRALATTSAVGAAGLGYAWWEARWFTVHRVNVPVLPRGARPLRVLHISDLHLTPHQHRKRAWLRGLAALRPDLVVNTGDSIAHQHAVPVLLDDLGELLDLPGVFVLGSNDYFAPTVRNPAGYLLPDDGTRRTGTRQLPWRDLRTGLRRGGWADLSNHRTLFEAGGMAISFAGVDDPHLGYDDLDAVAGPADPAADLRLAVSHAPYLRVLDRFAADGYDAILAGHTHGGQLCLPGGRAIVTNCDIDRRRASGLSRHPAGSVPGDPGSCWLHVSAGAGTSPYSPVRFCCRPSATLLTFT